MFGCAKNTDSRFAREAVVVHLTVLRLVSTAQNRARAQPKPKCLAHILAALISYSEPKLRRTLGIRTILLLMQPGY